MRPRSLVVFLVAFSALGSGLAACGGETVATADRSLGPANLAGAGGVAGGSASGAGRAGASGDVATGGSAAQGGASPVGSIEQFLGDVEGVWLVGWSGGLNHFSWMQFRIDDDFTGRVRILDPVDVPSNVPFWGCQGEGTWNLAARPNTIAVHFPEGCLPAMSPLTFGPLVATTMPGAIAQATVEVNATPAPSLVAGYKTDGSRCDAAFTVCKGPF